jgi:uncharacterized protein
MTLQPENKLTASVSQQERIVLLDSLRGIATLGILLMNIPGFGFPQARANDPSLYNETGINYNTWYIVEWVFSGTQRAIFSMLFGAGIILFITRLEKKMDGIMPAMYFFRRQMWLLAFGLFDAFVLLWFWDILFAYAILGMFLFIFYRSSTKSLFLFALVSLALMTIRDNVDLYRDKKIIQKGELVAGIDTTHNMLTSQQKRNLDAMLALKKESSKEAKLEKAEKEMHAIAGNYESLYKVQGDKSVHVELYYTYFLVWDIVLFMFLGMAFFKTGIMTGDVSTGIYWILCIGGLGLGLLLSYYQQEDIIKNHFNHFEYSKNVAFNDFQLARMLRSTGFFAFIMLLYKSGRVNWFFNMLRPVGQMAFTNYLMQSLLGALFFYGVGLNYFGRLERFELYIYTGVVWIIEIAWSHIWLHYFRMGPLEWLWRSLTWWKKQPIKRSSGVTEKLVAV